MPNTHHRSHLSIAPRPPAGPGPQPGNGARTAARCATGKTWLPACVIIALLPWRTLVAEAAPSSTAEGGSTPPPGGEAPAVDQAEDEDVVVLNNEHRLTGKVIDGPDPTALYLRTSAGLLAVDRSMVARVEAGFTTRKERLQPDDYAGHLDLAKWCMVQGRREDALALLQRFANDPQIDLEGMGLLARLTDVLEGPEQAFPLYRRYAEAGGQDPIHLKRLGQLQTAQEAYDEAVAKAEERMNSYTVEEGLEVRPGWRSELAEWANPMEASIEVIPGGVKNQGLKLSFQGGDKHKASALRGSRLDVRPTPIMVMDIFNPTDSNIAISIAVKTGEQWDYYESIARSVAPDGNWHRVHFNLLEESFKCKKDGYAKHSFAVADPDQIRELQFQVHNGKQDGHIWIDNIGFEKAGSFADDSLD